MTEQRRSAVRYQPPEFRPPVTEPPPLAEPSAGELRRNAPRLSLRVLLLVAALLVVHAVLAWYLRAWGITTGDDDAGYVLLARSLRAGQYRDLHDVLLPVGARYPPGYPALLALVSMLTGERIGAYVAVSIVSSVAALWLLFDAVRRQWSVALAVMVLAVAAVNPFLIQNAGRIMSEAPFTALVMLTVWAALRFDDHPRGGWAAGGAAIAAALTRSAGLPLVAALGLLWLVRRRFARVITFGLIATATCGVWTAWTVVAPNAAERGLYVADAVAGGHEQRSLPAAVAQRLTTNAKEYATQFLPAELPLPSVSGTVVDNVVGFAIVATCLTIGFAGLWKRWRAAALSLALYAVLLVGWAWAIDRFLDPVLPLLLLTLLAGALALSERLTPSAWAVPIIVALAVGLAAVAADRTLAGAQQRCDRRDPTHSLGCVSQAEVEFFDASRYAAANTPRNAIVVTSKARPFYYYSNRRTVSSAAVALLAPAPLVARMHERSADYLLLTSLGFLAPAVHQRVVDACESFTVDRAFGPSTVLLKLRTDTADARTVSACGVLRAMPAPPVPVGVRQ